MASWITIASADLEDYLMAPQLAVLRTAVLGETQSDPFTNVMQARCNYVRNRIAGRSQISATAYSVPPELKDQTCWLILEKLSVRIPVLKLTQDQRDQVARAYKDLDIAGTEDLPISAPDDAETLESASGAAPSFTDTTPNFSREAQDGI